MKRYIKLLIVGVALSAGILIGGAVHVGARQTHPEPVRGTVHVVRSGETMWGIVRHAYPAADPRQWIERVSKVNHLRSSAVHAGQRLLLPTP